MLMSVLWDEINIILTLTYILTKKNIDLLCLISDSDWNYHCFSWLSGLQTQTETFLLR